MIEKAIHEILADPAIPDAVALLALLPADRIVTGINHDRDLPYASLNLESNQSEYRSNVGAMRRPGLRFQVWHEDHAAGTAIRLAIEKLFENESFVTSELNLMTRFENSFTLQEPDGTWQFTIDLSTQSTLK